MLASYVRNKKIIRDLSESVKQQPKMGCCLTLCYEWIRGKMYIRMVPMIHCFTSVLERGLSIFRETSFFERSVSGTVFSKEK